MFAVKRSPGKTGEEMLAEANEAFPVFVNRYKAKIDMESLGIAKVKFDKALLEWKEKPRRKNRSTSLPN